VTRRRESLLLTFNDFRVPDISAPQHSSREQEGSLGIRKYSNQMVWFTAFLMLICGTGCSDPDKTSGVPGLTAPTVISLAPPNASTGVCANTIVTATFSKAMDPATVTTSTSLSLVQIAQLSPEQLPTVPPATQRSLLHQ
jgi:hypothetical protein